MCRRHLQPSICVSDNKSSSKCQECADPSRYSPYSDEEQDSLLIGRTTSGLAVCLVCKVIFHQGKFSWLTPVHELAERIKCPACLRCEQQIVGGTIELVGKFMMKHKLEIMELVAHTEELEKKYHPLQRIIKITENELVVLINTTYQRLAHRIGERVYSACGGKIRCQNSMEGNCAQVFWSRN